MGVKPPTAEELIPRIQAKEENDLLQAKTKELFGENIYVQRATYYSLSYAEQKAFRASQPDVWAAIDASNKFKDNFAEMYPVWASFYTSQTKTTSGTSAYGGSTSGGTSATKKTSSTGTGKTTLVFPDGSIDLDYPLRGDFLKMGKRSTIYVNQLLSGVKIGTGGTAGLPKWPPELMEVLGGLMVQEFINSLRSQAPLSAAALKYLRSIKNNHPEWAQFLDEMEALTASSTKETVT
jgi:hypothetical protein